MMQVYVLFLLILAMSCSPGISRSKLDEAGAFLEYRPDSALAMLQEMDTTLLKTQADRARYSLLLAASLDKNYIDTADVHILRPALDYYGRRKDDASLLRTYYYLGRMQHNGGDYNEAIVSYTEAEHLAEHSEDLLQKGLLYMSIADVYRRTYNLQKNFDYVQKGLAAFQSVGDTARSNLATGLSGLAYNLLKDWSSADSLFREGVRTAVRDTVAMRFFLSRYARMKVLQPEPDPAGAIALLTRKMTEYRSPLTASEACIYAYSSELLGNTVLCDRVMAQVDTAMEEYSSWLYRILLHRKDYAATIPHLLRANARQDSLVREAVGQSVNISLQEYYRRDAAKSEAHVLRVRNRYLLLLLTFLSVLGFVIYLFRQKSVRASEEKVRLMATAEIAQRLLTQSKEREEGIRSAFLALYEDHFRGVSSLLHDYFVGADDDAVRQKYIFGKVEKMISFVEEKEDLQRVFEQQIDRYCDNVLSRMDKALGGLTRRETRLVSYYIAGFDSGLISTILNTSISNVYSMKSRLRLRIQSLPEPERSEFLASL